MTTTTKEVNHAEENAKAWYSSIEEMVDRVNHARECRNSYEDYLEDVESCDGVTFDSEEDFDEYHNEEKARQAIEESILSVEVKSGWTTPGNPMESEEYMILLTTGGPALRLTGDLDQFNQPETTELEYQDWGTPWTRLAGTDQDTLLTFAQCFYFGE